MREPEHPSGEAADWLRRAITAARRGELEEARRCRDRAVADGTESGDVFLVSGALSGSLGEFDRSLRDLRRAAEIAPGLGRESATVGLDVARAFRSPRDAWAIAAAADAADPGPGGDPYRAELFRLSFESGLYETTLGVAARLTATGRTVDARSRIATAAAYLGRREEAAEAALTVLAAATGRGPDRARAIGALLDAGAFAEAEAALARILATDPDAESAAILARLCLWRRDGDSAEAAARQALALDAKCVSALVTLGASAWLGGAHAGPSRTERLRDAVGLLDQALAGGPDREAYLWRGRARLALGWSEGVDDFERAAQAGHGPSLTADILRLQVRLERRRRLVMRFPRPLRKWATSAAGRSFVRDERGLLQFHLAALDVLRPGARRIVTDGDLDAIDGLLASALSLLGMNCSELTTVFRDGGLERIRLPDVRSECLAAIGEGLVIQTPEEVRRRLVAAIAKYPDSPLPRCYLGEFLLWMGDIDQARHALEDAIRHTRYTRWAYIGLGACALVENDPARALKVLRLGVRRMGDAPGPPLYAHRGEAFRRLGRLREARSDLSIALEAAPRRMSGWINLGLLEAAEKNYSALADIFALVRRRAPALLSDAAEELRTHAWGDHDALPPPATQVRLLEHALGMLRGNRSSGLITYFRVDGRFRTIPAEHADDAADRRPGLEICEALFRRRVSGSGEKHDHPARRSGIW